MKKEYKLRMIRQILDRLSEIEDDERSRRNSDILDKIIIAQAAVHRIAFSIADQAYAKRSDEE